ncbi:MAG: hypothetical protein ACSLFK_06515 [Gemmatimonadaceae bacterium]
MTTASLTALQLFTRAQDETREGRGESALTLSLLRDAIAEDSSFAMAHRFLGIKLYLIGSTQEAIRSLRSAERFSGRLTEVERLQAMSTLHLVLLDYARSADEAQRVLGLQPNGLWAINQLGILNILLGRYDQGMQIARLRLAIDPSGQGHGPGTAFHSGNASHAFAQARRSYGIDKDQPTSHRAQWARQLAALHAATGRYDSAEYYAGSVSESVPGRMEVLVSSQLARGHIRRSFITAGVGFSGSEPRAFERVDVPFTPAGFSCFLTMHAGYVRFHGLVAHTRLPASLIPHCRYTNAFFPRVTSIAAFRADSGELSSCDDSGSFMPCEAIRRGPCPHSISLSLNGSPPTQSFNLRLIQRAAGSLHLAFADSSYCLNSSTQPK